MPHRAGFCVSCGQEMFAEARFCTYCGAERSVPRVPESETPEDRRKILEIRKVGAWSLVKLSFMANAVIGLVFGLALAAVGMSGMGMSGFPFPMEGGPLIGMAPWIGLILVAPLLYGLMGAFFGLVLAILYNVMAWGVGGIRITVQKR